MPPSLEGEALAPQPAQVLAVTLNGPAGLASDADLARFSSNLSRLRNARSPKLSRAALAHQIGASDKQIEHWEDATNNPPIRYILRLAEFFGVSIYELLGVSQDLDREQTHLGMLLKMTSSMDSLLERQKQLEDAIARERIRGDTFEAELAASRARLAALNKIIANH